MSTGALQAFRLISFVAGWAILVVAIFLRPHQRDRAQEWLEASWSRSDDLQSEGMRRQASLARATVELAAQLLDRIFGVSWVSPKAVTSAVWLSIASFIAWMQLISALPMVRVQWNPWLAALVLVLLLYCALDDDPRLNAARAWAGWGLSFFAASWYLAPLKFPEDVSRLASVMVVLALGVLCSLVFVRVMGLILRIAARLKRFSSVALMAIVNLGVAVLFYVGPMTLGWGYDATATSRDPTWRETIAGLVPITNTLDVVLALNLFVLWAVVAISRMLRTTVNQVLVTFVESKMLHHPLRVALLGIYLINLGSASVGKAVQQIIRIVFGIG